MRSLAALTKFLSGPALRAIATAMPRAAAESQVVQLGPYAMPTFASHRKVPDAPSLIAVPEALRTGRDRPASRNL